MTLPWLRMSASRKPTTAAPTAYLLSISNRECGKNNVPSFGQSETHAKSLP